MGNDNSDGTDPNHQADDIVPSRVLDYAQPNLKPQIGAGRLIGASLWVVLIIFFLSIGIGFVSMWITDVIQPKHITDYFIPISVALWLLMIGLLGVWVKSSVHPSLRSARSAGMVIGIALSMLILTTCGRVYVNLMYSPWH